MRSEALSPCRGQVCVGSHHAPKLLLEDREDVPDGGREGLRVQHPERAAVPVEVPHYSWHRPAYGVMCLPLPVFVAGHIQVHPKLDVVVTQDGVEVGGGEEALVVARVAPVDQKGLLLPVLLEKLLRGDGGDEPLEEPGGPQAAVLDLPQLLEEARERRAH